MIIRLLAAVLGAALAAAGPGCAREVPAPAPAPSVPEQTPPAGPSRAHLSLVAAMEALEQGRLQEAVRRLEEVLSLEAEAAERGAALYSLAVLLARPGSPARDVARARGLLEEFLETDPPAARAEGARLILGLLDVEGRYEEQIRELRGRAAVAGAEADDLRIALAQKEAELRRIKEILLGRTGGL